LDILIIKEGRSGYWMNGLRKIIVIALISGLLLASFVYYAAGWDKESDKESGKEEVKGTETGGLMHEYIRFSGTIAEISTNGEYFTLLVENNDEEEPYDKMVFTLEKDGVLVSNKTMDLIHKDDIKEGANVWVFYHKDTPILESYPARAGCNVVAVMEEDGIPNVEVYKFDKDLVSTDRIIKIFPNEETKIVDIKDNALTEKDIKNKSAIVFYEAADLSLPMQVAPKKVIVLD